MLMNLNRLYDWATDEVLKTPTMTMRGPLPGWDIIRTATPEKMEHILKTKFDNYIKGQHFSSLYSDFAGVAMLTADGSVWKLQHRFAIPNFSTQMIRGLVLSSF
ncbi:hypothetical protein KC19_11G090900 [Ceratodon purpureus]|uniref:Cytochrome P450 n=1 Tax=Ceratodon purpureus TaxID=3225 RepID=A0A8T0GFM0_CERPU|nr:hypothetical protein KC19_11G090900 [Ceratodon purpureus]